MRRWSLPAIGVGDDYRAITRLWCLRALVSPILKSKMNDRLWCDEALTELLCIEGRNAPENPKAVRQFLVEQHEQAESQAPELRGLLFSNVSALGAQLDFSQVDEEVLALLVLARLEEPLHDVLELPGRLTDPRFHRLVATVLARDLASVAETLSSAGRLGSTRIVVLERSVATFEDKVQVAEALSHALTRTNQSLDELISYAAERAGGPRLSLRDYDYLDDHISLLRGYLQQAVAARRRGVNILLYGPPGNGKTEFAKALARDLALMLYEVRYADRDGDPIAPEQRISSYILMQSILRRQPQALILFDEIEDILPRQGGVWEGEQRKAMRRKAWLNRTLEENAVPAVWIGNQVTDMDPAFLRRFDYVMCFRTPPRSARARLLRAQLQGLPVSDAWLERKIDQPGLTPGIVSKLAQVLESRKSHSNAAVESAFDLMARGRLEAQGKSVGAGRYPYPVRYRVDLLNASVDPLAVARRLGDRRRGNLLLYGAPGTGKTAFAHYVARTLDAPLLVRRASDIISMWVGETEKLISLMFEEAVAERAVLLLDEADSFLQDRRYAARNWEITQVNELLTRMEEFEGIFICATNFVEHLDAAAMRRFSLKVRLDPLSRGQARILFTDTLKECSIPQTDELEAERVLREIEDLASLTPGDFLAARRALDLDAFPLSAAGLLQALKAELATRPERARRPMGFAA